MKRKWFLAGGRPKYEGDGAVELVCTPQSARKSTRSVPLPILDFLQKKFGFQPKGTALNKNKAKALFFGVKKFKSWMGGVGKK
ncbi:MAG: hypothetical protein PF487_11230 [Bacteroidales bacterium]|nr:hypothetical protein [Bacteroidales bacterium]